MTLRPGERQAMRSRDAVKAAFGELLREKGYGDVSVGAIASRANVGRSTFYRHFESKADVLVALHEDIFSDLFLGMTLEQWKADSPPGALVKLVGAIAQCSPMFSLGGDIGVDVDYVMRGVVRVMGQHVVLGLEQEFSDATPSVPVEVVASSVAGVYAMTLMSWKDTFRDVSPDEMAECIHRLTRALVREAFG